MVVASSTIPSSPPVDRQRSNGTQQDNSRSRSRSPAASKALYDVMDTTHTRNTSSATGKSIDGTNKSNLEKKVRVRPPFACDDPPSPTHSPRLDPTTSSPKSTSNQLQPVITYDSESTSVGPNDPAPWWTFVSWPGRHQKPPERRFSQRQSGFSPTTPTVGGIKWRDPEINLDSEERDEYFQGLNGTGEGGPGPSTLVSRFKISRSHSRRASTDDHPKKPNKMDEDRQRGFTLDSPFAHRISSSRRSVTYGPTTEMEQIQSPISEPTMGKARASSWQQVVAATNATDAAAASQKQQKSSTEDPTKDPETPPSRLRSRMGDLNLRVTLPPSAVVHEPPGTIPSNYDTWRLEGQAPPTPDGWDTSWEHGPQVYKRGRRRMNGGTAWEEEFEEQDEYDLDADTNESTAVERRSGSEEGKKVDVRKGSRKARFTAIVEIRKQRMKMLFLQNAMVALGVRIFNLGCVLTVLGLAASLVYYERLVQIPGIIGPSPVLTLAYAALTAFHVSFAIWMEWRAKPIGLWDLKRKMSWICLDLLFIALWSSDLSVAICDFLATPMGCSNIDPWWNPLATPAIEDNPLLDEKHNAMCDRQSAIIAFVAFILVSYVANMVLSLFKTLEKVALAARAPTRSKARGV